LSTRRGKQPPPQSCPVPADLKPEMTQEVRFLRSTTDWDISAFRSWGAEAVKVSTHRGEEWEAVIDYELVTVSAREVWTTVARGGNWLITIAYHDGQWRFSAPEVEEGVELVWPEGRIRRTANTTGPDKVRPGVAPVGLGYPLAGAPRGALIGRTLNEEGRPSEPFLIGRETTVGPFPGANPDYFLIQVGANILNPTRARGALRVRVRRIPREDQVL